jgi:hypothetical protein
MFLFVTYETQRIYDEFTGGLKELLPIPTDNSDVLCLARKNSNSSFNFDVNTNGFMYLRSSQVMRIQTSLLQMLR